MGGVKIRIGDFLIGDEELNAVNKVLRSGRISEGRETLAFEIEFSKYIGATYTVATNSGTSALVAGMLALLNDDRFPRFQKGKKVLMSPVTYIADANAVAVLGMIPAFADIDPVRFTLIPEAVEEEIKKSPDSFSAILPVHLMGYPNDMDKLQEIADKYGLILLEDSAQAHGSIYKGKKTGSLGLMSFFSFYIAHNIQAGELGAVTTKDEKLMKMLLQVKANGRACDCPVCTRPQGYCPKEPSDEKDDDPRFTHEFIGLNFKTMDLITTIARVQLKRADEIAEKRRYNVRILNTKLSKFSDALQLPEYDENVSYLGYPIIIKDDQISRKELRLSLEGMGVENRPLFGCIPLHQPAYKELKDYYEGRLKNAEFVGRRGFYIGCHQYLTDNDLNFVESVFAEVMKRWI